MLFPFMLLWLAIGAFIGFVVSKVVNLRGDAPIGGIGVAALGAAATGITYNLYSGNGLNTWHIWSCLAAAAGAAVAVTVWHLVRSRYVSHETVHMRRSY